MATHALGEPVVVSTGTDRFDEPARRTWVLAILAGLGCVLAYGPNFGYLASRWLKEPNYSHGWLVPFIASWVLWRRRAWLARAERAESKGWLIGLVGLLGILGARSWLFQRNEIWLENLTFLAALAFAWIALLGLKTWHWFWPGLLFALFLFPLPGRVDSWLAFPLQRLATLGSSAILQILGIPSLVEGNVLTIADHKLEVARACNGLSMMLTLICVVATVAMLLETRTWQRWILLASAVPIALVCNILRIASTAVTCWLMGSSWITVREYAHDFAGYAMMPLGFGLVILETKILSWLMVNAPDDSQAQLKASVRPIQRN